MKRFGSAYGTDLEEIPVPIGQFCERCGLMFGEGDQGVAFPGGEYMHVICLLDAVLGPRWAGSFPRPRTEEV